MATPLHVITCEYPPLMGGVSEHTRVLAEAAAAAGYDVHVWTGSQAVSSNGVHVRTDLGDFSQPALMRAGTALDRWPPPRRVVVQWVPHGYGRKGLNVAFARWICERARAGDRIELIVHEPFIDFFGSSWRQPAAALIQRYMTWSLVRAAARVWLTIPAWEKRVSLARPRDQPAPRTLPVPGTIPPVRDAPAVARLRGTLLNGRSRLVGYFGTGGPYPLEAIALTVSALATSNADVALVGIGRCSEAFASAVHAAVPGVAVPCAATGPLALERVSLHLQACDALLQPYSDGVSGRRTTTVSALEHGIPVATTIGRLSEPFWTETRAVEAVPAASPETLHIALVRLLEPTRNASAREAAVALYRDRFDPVRTFKDLFDGDSAVTPERRAEVGLRN